MIKVESLKDYLYTLTEEEFMELTNEIYMIVDFLCEDYPEHKNWYYTKQIPGIKSNERNILFVRNPKNKHEIIATAFLKRDNEEQKICTIYVKNQFRNQGIGTLIIEHSLEWLGTTKPLITFSDRKLNMFIPIIEKYNLELAEIVSDLYNLHHKELCFNGKLSKGKEMTLKEELTRRLIKSLNKRKSQLNV